MEGSASESATALGLQAEGLDAGSEEQLVAVGGFLCPRCHLWHRTGENHPKPKPGDEYVNWLDRAWNGDARELREGRYLHQQGDLERSFLRSEFWLRVESELDHWARQYEQESGFPLFQGPTSVPEMKLKPWTSFLSRNWRHNVHNNENWPNPPADGWLFPDTWFERSWDIVRTRFIVRYLDGVKFLSETLKENALELGHAATVYVHAQEFGYYAVHVTVAQPFEVSTLAYEAKDERRSAVEIQITTELQEVVTTLTHGYFERRREEDPEASQEWQWQYDRPDFSANYLGHMIHFLEGTIMQLRDADRSENSATAGED